jgi:DNA repair exonuclease SbcCD nuclease subunit
MEKALIFSDLHVHNYKQFNEDGRRLKNGVAFLDYIFKLANANGIKIILFPGDLFNNMQIMATKAVNAVAACLQMNFEAYPDVALIAISGNHDDAEKNLIDNPSESALDYLDYVFPNFILLDHYPHTFHTSNGTTIRGIRYYEHSEHFRAALNEAGIEQNKKNTILLTHQIIGSGLPIEDDIEPTDPLFDPFTLVLNGHIHNCEQLTDKFINVGSPMMRDAGDIGKQKGFWIVDLDNPVETIAFKDITDKYPNFIHKTQGEALTEWESQQYVIWQPAPIADSVKDQKLAEKFSTNLAPAKILENYCAEVLPKEELKDKLAYGLTLLQ